MDVEGFCDPRFQDVAEQFTRNFHERGEIGAAVAIFVEGELVVNLWGGTADQETGRAWEEDTMALVYSSTKGLAAICLNILIDRRLIEIDAPVACYWPEFAANGKEHVTVGMIMSHQAGLPFFQEDLPDGGYLNWKLVTSRLAAEAPVWEPGTQHGYHAVTLGFLEGEILRRVTGKTIGQFLRDEVAGPLEADIWIGCHDSEHCRIATSYFDDPNPESPLFKRLMTDPDWFGARFLTNTGNDNAPGVANRAERRRAEIPAAGGIVTARGLARAYSPLSLDGSIDGVRIVSEKMLPLMRTTRSASGKDVILQVPTTFTLGFSKSWGARHLGEGEHVIMGEAAFGTAGYGGSVGFADGDARMAFAYVMNRHGPGVGLNNRGQSLIDAAYQAVGFTTSAPGFWMR